MQSPTGSLTICEAELYAANSTMIECIYLYQLAQFLMGDGMSVRQRLFLGSSIVSKICGAEAWSWEAEACGNQAHVLAAALETEGVRNQQHPNKGESVRPEHEETHCGEKKTLKCSMWSISFVCADRG